MRYEIHQYKVWRGIDRYNKTWASLGFLFSDRDTMNEVLELLTTNTKELYKVISYES
jgi:hypothetical protein